VTRDVVLLVGRGSAEQARNGEFLKFCDAIEPHLGPERVETCFIELTTPPSAMAPASKRRLHRSVASAARWPPPHTRRLTLTRRRRVGVASDDRAWRRSPTSWQGRHVATPGSARRRASGMRRPHSSQLP